MAVPKLGVDGHRRLTVTVTLLDGDADLLWAVAYLEHGNAAGGCSKVTRAVLIEALHEYAKVRGEQVRNVVHLLEEHRSEVDAVAVNRRALRVVR